jgi:aminoglycoside phosphotransferase (APT) family kinase protein
MSTEEAPAPAPAPAATPTIDLVRLAAWMDEAGLPDAGAPLTAKVISGGSQNEIFEIRRGDFHAALRKPPATAAAGRNEGILREWRIIEALDDTDVPHTKAYAVCTDADVLGGTFYLMGFVDGWSPMNHRDAWPEPFNSNVGDRRGLAFQLVEGVARMGSVDWQAKGLSDLGKPEGFHDRQVDRWLAFYGRVKTREIPGMDVATQWLRTHRPLDFIPGIMHGDYQWANVMYKHGSPAGLAAIIDWEMGTIGDPKLDLGWVLQVWPDHPGEKVAMSYVDTRDMPTREELVAHFVAESGRQCDDIDYYVVLARWKLGVVLEQGYAAALKGLGDEKLLTFGETVSELMRRAANYAESSAYPEAK